MIHTQSLDVECIFEKGKWEAIVYFSDIGTCAGTGRTRNEAVSALCRDIERSIAGEYDVLYENSKDVALELKIQVSCEPKAV